MKIAFIVQRYGADILGGSEYHCRLIAERMAQRHDVEVLTTCARDYITWKNEYAEGVDRVRGVTVRRFANARTRDIEAFNRYSDWIFHYAHTADDEREWLEQQGPWCPGLQEYLERHAAQYDFLIFFTYLYAPTVLGLRVAPHKSILVPTAHDEPAIRLGLYREVFAKPAGMAYNTEVERRMLADMFGIGAVAQDTIGCGVDLPVSWLRERREPRGGGRERRDADPGARGGRHGGRDRRERAAAAGTPEDGDAAPEVLPRDTNDSARFGARPRGSAFRRRHRLHGPFVLYGGRIDPGKGCEELFEYFAAYREAGGDAALVLMGVKLMAIPEEPWVRFAGTLPEQERLLALEAATVVAVPSPYESLSLLALESFAMGTPILANGRSDVLTAHCRASNAGLYYENQDEFVEALSLLMASPRLREGLGRNGRAYVRANYEWDVILAKYDRLMAKVRQAG
ncbi:MAG: glycosyltransferase family 4 protein [Vicinamibacteraceae bacterium]|nr:glycosyltransferase family 4 protein [Vicinamibacteraceae bacterium]